MLQPLRKPRGRIWTPCGFNGVPVGYKHYERGYFRRQQRTTLCSEEMLKRRFRCDM